MKKVIENVRLRPSPSVVFYVALLYVLISHTADVCLIFCLIDRPPVRTQTTSFASTQYECRGQLEIFASPERYVQGRNALAELGNEMGKLGMEGPVILVSSATPRRLLEAAWTESLQEMVTISHTYRSVECVLTKSLNVSQMKPRRLEQTV